MNTHSLSKTYYWNDVKMSFTWGQSAWILVPLKLAILTVINYLKKKFFLALFNYCYIIIIFFSNILLNFYKLKANLIKNSSETKRSVFSSGTIKNSINFNEWLVGLTDGDGTFYFAKNKKGVWNFTFKIGQSNYNLRLLFYVKSNIGIGSISIPNYKDKTAEYRVRNIQHIIDYIIPIFDQFPLLTSKYFKYNLFKKAILIMNDSKFNNKEKDNLISDLKSQSLPYNYISPVWQVSNNSVSNLKEARKVMTKSWLIGFTEAKFVSFNLIKNKSNYLTEFSVNSYDKIIIQSIKLFFHISSNIELINGVYTIKTINQYSILIIIKFFTKSFKGLNSLNFKLWSKANNHNNYIERIDYNNTSCQASLQKKNIKLLKIYEILNKIKLKYNSLSVKKEKLLNENYCFDVSMRGKTAYKKQNNIILLNNYICSSRSYSQISRLNNSSSSNMIIWGSNLESGVGKGRINNIVRNMYGLPYFQRSVITGLLLSDGWSVYSSSSRKNGVVESKLNARIGFRQSYEKFNYFFFVFNILSHYCSSYPYLSIGKRNNTITKSLTLQTRSLKCMTELHQLFYVNGKKTLPSFLDLYFLLNPIALANWIYGDGMASKKGLVLCTDSYSLDEVVRLVNILIIRYNFTCKIRFHKDNQYRIYISEKSLESLKRIVLPFLDNSMLYKL